MVVVVVVDTTDCLAILANVEEMVLHMFLHKTFFAFIFFSFLPPSCVVVRCRRRCRRRSPHQRYTNYNHTAAEIQIVLPYGQSCGGSAMLADIRQITAGLNEEYKQYGFEVYGAINVRVAAVDGWKTKKF